MDMLTLSHVSKAFGSHTIIKDLSFRVPEHTVFGFIGQNGAGKTTTMKMILGLVKADGGEITVNGEKVCYGQNRTNRYIGYLPDVPEYYGYMKPTEYLRLCGRIFGMKEDKIAERTGEMLELVGLENADKRIHGFSRGMKQRLGIAQALLHQPKLLICDEPTSALDPLGRREILDILSAVKEHTTVIFSTHILSDVEQICDEIALLHDGHIVRQGSLKEMHHMQESSGFEIEFVRPQETEQFLSLVPGGKRVGSTRLLYEKQKKEEMHAAMQFCVSHTLYPKRIEMCEPTLEAMYMEVIGK